MKRREFITLLGGAAALELTSVMPAFHEGLNAAGFAEGRNIAIEYRWAEGHYERLPALAGELVARHVAVIAAISGTPAALAAKAATTTIPIVFAIGGDPVAPGLVTNLSRPGGNITGASFFTSPVVTKRLELARELAQPGTTIGVFVNPDNPPSVTEGKTVQEAAAVLGLPIQIVTASTEGQIDRAFAVVAQQKMGAVIVSSDPLFFIERNKLVVLQSRYGVPTIFADREQAEAGGLISYGASRPDAYRQAGNYIGRIVKGEKPGDLPVVLPTKYILLVNRKTAKALGISLPPSLLARADEVIE
jgi:putative ABC transport system substrate-binding protein